MHVIMFKKNAGTSRVTCNKLEALIWSFIQNEKKNFNGQNRVVPLTLLFNLLMQESYKYKDPITEFVECLYVNFDFDGAQQKLRECEEVSF